MDIILFIIVIVAAIISSIAYIVTQNQLCKKQAHITILREREAMASRLIFSYCRRLLLDTDRSYVNKENVVAHMNHVL